MTSWKELGLQNGSSPLMEYLDFFHDFTILVLIMVTLLLVGVIVDLVVSLFSDSSFMDHQSIEFIWTVLPGVILLFIAFPSLQLLYLMDESMIPNLTIKVMGHQWFWVYTYSNYSSLEIESYMTPESDLKMGDLRLLDVDTRTCFPYMSEVRLLVSSADVLHAWTIPALGVKVDAVPGRLNQLNLFAITSGLFYGQCSEVCGANHSFMPIVMEAVPMVDFTKWASSF